MGDRRRADFSLRQLQAVYHLPLRDAARALGVCEAALKRICRRRRVLRWPFRQLSSVQRRLAGLQSRSADENAPPNQPPRLELPTDAVKKRMLVGEWRRIVRSAHEPSAPRAAFEPKWTRPLFVLASACEAEQDARLRLLLGVELGLSPTGRGDEALRLLAEIAVARDQSCARC